MLFDALLFIVMAVACFWAGGRRLWLIAKVKKEGGCVQAKVTGYVQTKSRQFYSLQYRVGGVLHTAQYAAPTMGKRCRPGDTVTFYYVPGKDNMKYIEEDKTDVIGAWLMIAMGVAILPFAVITLTKLG